MLGLDLGGLDLPLAHWFGNAQGFAWRDHWLMSQVLHSGARTVGWLLLIALTFGLVWPWGWLKAQPRRDRHWMVASIWLSLLLVVGIKGISTSSCPWDLAVFGGSQEYVSHWARGVASALPGAPGHCFPAGHASTAFAFLAVPVWLKTHQPHSARWALVAVLVAGTVIGLAQQVRGAHFLSHTLWTAWMCWAMAMALHRWATRRPH